MMKKYITPAVEITAMHTECVMVESSFTIDSSVTVGGGGGTDPGQLTNGYGWNADDWSE